MMETQSPEKEAARENLIKLSVGQVTEVVCHSFQDGISINNDTKSYEEDGIVVITFPAYIDMGLHKKRLESAAKNWVADVKEAAKEGYDGNPTAMHLYTGDSAEMVADLIEKNGVRIEQAEK